jgi:hypothetical protein
MPAAALARIGRPKRLAPGGTWGAPVTLADGLGGPLQIDASADGSVLVAQDFASTISRVGRNGTVTKLADGGGLETPAVAAGPFGSVFYTQNDDGGHTSLLKVRDAKGRIRTFADLGAYEATRNPDQVRTYGIEGPVSPECFAQAPPEVGPANYPGQIDSHPYSLAMTPFGVLVGDAAGNDVLFVDWSGRIRTVTVLPVQPFVITPAFATANGLPDCIVGRTYDFEPVPTDVEVGRDGNLYVTTLPGGPEDPSAGARGSVYRVNPWTGKTTRVATGFAGATNLALAPDGTIYVAELFANRISKVVGGAPAPVVDLTEPAAVEWSNGKLVATSDVFGSGKVVVISRGGPPAY